MDVILNYVFSFMINMKMCHGCTNDYWSSHNSVISSCFLGTLVSELFARPLVLVGSPLAPYSPADLPHHLFIFCLISQLLGVPWDSWNYLPLLSFFLYLCTLLKFPAFTFFSPPLLTAISQILTNNLPHLGLFHGCPYSTGADCGFIALPAVVWADLSSTST